LKINHVCFDLDGTLVKSDKTILNAVFETLNILNIDYEIDEDEFKNAIGLHFFDIFQQFNIQVPDFNKFIKIYKSVYFDFIDESELYPDVANTLISLSKKDNMKISLLTTKSQDQAEKIVNHFEIGTCFDYIMGRRDGMKYKPSGEPLKFICKKIYVDICSTLIVGDTELDINCGKNAGAMTCAVTYGYRSEKKLRQLNPDYIIEGMGDLNLLFKLD
jgi:phosphoglycolate phosphatase/pyrophosphatase PpaX